MRRRFLALLLPTLIALLAGCGGGDDEAQAPPPSAPAPAEAATPAETGEVRLTKAQWIEEADAICVQAEDELEALGTPESLADIVALVPRAIEISEKQLGKLRALRPPAADEATLTRALDLLEQQIDVLRRLGEAATAGDGAAVGEIATEGNTLNKEADRIAQAYGLEVCGSDEPAESETGSTTTP